MKILVSSKLLYEKLKQFDFKGDQFESVFITKDGEIGTLKICDDKICIEQIVHLTNDYDYTLCDSQFTWQTIMNICRVVSERPITLFISAEHIYMSLDC